MMSEPIRLARPLLDGEESEAISRVLASGMLVQGREVEAFEREVAERCGRQHAIAVSSGTAALELALRALGCVKGEVALPALTWPSPAHAAKSVGANVVFVDVEPREWNSGAAEFRPALGPSTRAIVAIDQFGFPAPHAEIAALGVPVIEDAACAIGAMLGDRPCGAFGVISCLSFHPRKIVTTGEGGMCLTDVPELAERVRTLRNHGQRAPGEFAEASCNYRMTELQAAMGRAQLGKLPRMLSDRRRIAARYREALGGRLIVQEPARDAAPNYQTFGVRLPMELDSKGRDVVIRHLGEHGIEAGRLSYALHTLPSLRDARILDRPIHTESIVDRGIALPLHSGLSDSDVERVVSTLYGALESLALTR